MFGSAKFTSEASRWGVQPGFIFDLNEGRPYGPGKGQPWDLANDDDMKDVKEKLEFEKPLLLVGGAACDAVCLERGGHNGVVERHGACARGAHAPDLFVVLPAVLLAIAVRTPMQLYW